MADGQTRAARGQAVVLVIIWQMHNYGAPDEAAICRVRATSITHGIVKTILAPEMPLGPEDRNGKDPECGRVHGINRDLQ